MLGGQFGGDGRFARGPVPGIFERFVDDLWHGQLAEKKWSTIAFCTIELSTGVTPLSVPVTLKATVLLKVSVGDDDVTVVVVTAPNSVPPIVNSAVATWFVAPGRTTLP